ncbi:MAG: DUF2169 domain-containing protein [Planctomycetota bacterium]
MSPFTLALIPGRMRFPAHSLTVVVKGTFDLGDGESATTAEEQLFPTGDEPYPDDEDYEGAPRYESDFAPFKPSTDVLLVGTCHPPEPTTACTVGFRVGRLSRRLQVSGARVWEGGPIRKRASEAQKFDKLDLRWESSFGGKKSPDNPIGTGLDARDENPRELPRIEDPADLVRTPADRPTPAGFGPMRRDWPVRWKRLGRYKGSWTKKRWPWYAEDLDWTHFNAAQSPMRADGYLQGDEELELENVIEGRPRKLGRLPGIKVECQVEDDIGDGQPRIRDLSMHLDTVWIDGDAQRLVLLWRGHIEVSDEDFQELRTLRIIARRIEDGATMFQDAPVESELADERPPPEEAETEAPETEDEEDPLEAVPGYAELMKHVQAQHAELNIDPQNPPDMTPEKIEAARVWMKEHLGLDLEPEPDADEEEEGSDNGWTRERVEHALAEGRDFVDEDLADLDLSGLAWPGTDLSGAILRGASFKETDLSGVTLARANLVGANFEGANLANANLESADATGAVFGAANLCAARAPDACLRDAVFVNAQMDSLVAPDAVFSGADLSGADLRSADLTNGDFTAATLTRANLDGARLASAAISGASAAGISLQGADITNLRAIGATDLTDANLRESNGPDSVWSGVTFVGADLSYGTFTGAVFNGSDLTAATLEAVDLAGTRFHRTRLERTNFTASNLYEASFERADLTDAVLTRANAYSCEFLNAVMDGAKLDGANLRGTKLAE